MGDIAVVLVIVGTASIISLLLTQILRVWAQTTARCNIVSLSTLGFMTMSVVGMIVGIIGPFSNSISELLFFMLALQFGIAAYLFRAMSKARAEAEMKKLISQDL